MPRYKKNKKINSKTKISAIIILVVLLVAGGLSYYFVNKQHKVTANTTKYYVPASPADNTPNNNRKGSSNPAQTLINSSTSNINSNAAGTFTVQINSAVVSSGNVHIGNTVDGITSGDCSLTASKGSSNVSLATSQVKQDINYYDCGVFNINTSSFPSTGNWTITLTVTNNGTQASNSTTADITSN